jgi:ribonuclease HII
VQEPSGEHMVSLSSLLKDSPCPEKILSERGYRYIAGVDEAGRGPLAGPVVASAVIFLCGWTHPAIKDSKQLTEKKRENLHAVISDAAVAWSWAAVDHQEIDRINILQASLKAMRNAVAALAITPDYLLIDGIYPIAVSIPQTPLIKGDQRSLATSAASIMAKVTRDALMKRFHEQYPDYNFARNKGYGTREHFRALASCGPSPIHRISFLRGRSACNGGQFHE